MLDEIIEKYCSNTLFIDIDNLTDYLNNLSVSERNKLLKEIFDYNNKVYKELQKQNKEYLKILNSDNYITENPVNKIKKVKEKLELEEKRQNNELQLDISFYLDCINHASNLNELDDILPDKSNIDYMDIINSILIKLIEEKVIIERLIKETSKEDSDIIYYQKELNKVLDKINYIKNYNSRINLYKKEVVKKENHVIFLTTNAGNNCFMNDLSKNIDAHYYGYVKDLLESIKDGSFKNVKAFTENSLLEGVFEVRLSQLRIIFRRLQPGIYVVIQVIVKKFQKGHQYHSSMIARNILYNSSEKALLSKVKDESYLECNEEVYKEVLNYLNINRKGDNSGKVNRKNK